MKNYLTALFIFSIIFSLARVAKLNAQESNSLSGDYDGIPFETIFDPMGKKFFRGLINVATGWVELPRQLMLTFKNDGVLATPTVGLFNGIVMIVARTGAGVYDTAFFVSSAPGRYDPVIDPGFVWEKRKSDYSLTLK